jgi:hypothetical protein
MLKEDVISFIVYIVMLALAAIVGFAVINPAFRSISTINGWNTAGYLIICLIISVLLEVMLFEIAHALGAKLGKYEVISFNVLGFAFYKGYDEKTKKNKIKFKFPSNFDGLTGETLIKPKSEKSNPLAYVLSPLFLFAIEVAILIILYITVVDPKNGQNKLDFLKYFQLVLVTVGGMLFIYDYTPAKLDTMTDGYRLVLLNKKVNIEAFNVLLSINGDEFLGTKVTKYKTFDEITDFTSQVNIASVRNYLKTDDYKDSLDLLDKIISSKSNLSFDSRTVAKIYKLYVVLYYGDLEEAKKLYESFDEKERDYLKSTYSMLTIRTSILYYGLAENSNSECENQLHKVKKALERVSIYSKQYEEELLRKTLTLLKEKNKEIEATY